MKTYGQPNVVLVHRQSQQGQVLVRLVRVMDDGCWVWRAEAVTGDRVLDRTDTTSVTSVCAEHERLVAVWSLAASWTAGITR